MRPSGARLIASMVCLSMAAVGAEPSLSSGQARDFLIPVSREAGARRGSIVLSLMLSTELPPGSHLVITTADGRVLGNVAPYGDGTGERPNYRVIVPTEAIERMADGTGQLSVRAKLVGGNAARRGPDLTLTPRIEG